MPFSLPTAAPLLLATSIAILPADRPARLGAIGTALVTLGLAAAGRVTEPPGTFHTINNAVLWTGLALVGAAVFEGWRVGGRMQLAPAALALAVTLAACSALLRQGSGVLSLTVGAVVGTGVWVLPARHVATRHESADSAAAAFLRRWGRLVLLLLLLLPASWLLITVSGPGLSVQAMRDAPLSVAAETLLAALILPATLVLAGVFPFWIIGRDARLAPVGALLLMLLVVPLVGTGLEHWRAGYAGWLVLGSLMAGWKARWPGLLACAGLFVIACGRAPSWEGGLLTVFASGMSIWSTASERWRRLLLLGAGLCGITALRATLGVEVVYSVAMVLTVIIGVLRTPTTTPLDA